VYYCNHKKEYSLKKLLCTSSICKFSLSFLTVCLIKPPPCVLCRHLLGIFAPQRTLYFDITGITRAFIRAPHVLGYLDYLVFISVTHACFGLFLFSPWPNFSTGSAQSDRLFLWTKNSKEETKISNSCWNYLHSTLPFARQLIQQK
jgi:hypothetical protein